MLRKSDLCGQQVAAKSFHSLLWKMPTASFCLLWDVTATDNKVL